MKDYNDLAKTVNSHKARTQIPTSSNIQKESQTRIIMKKFLEKLYPECESKIYKISFLIIIKIKKIKKINIKKKKKKKKKN